jgi:hypothetical protein
LFENHAAGPWLNVPLRLECLTWNAQKRRVLVDFACEAEVARDDSGTINRNGRFEEVEESKWKSIAFLSYLVARDSLRRAFFVVLGQTGSCVNPAQATDRPCNCLGHRLLPECGGVYQNGGWP